jgi:ABC-type amino acid transport substrate-binding protein
MRISLRQLLSLVAAVAVAIVSLKYASEAWQALVAVLTVLAFFASLVIAFVGRGPRQTFAMGAALAMGVYALIVQLEPRQVESALKWTTNAVLRQFYSAVVRTAYLDPTTGQELVGYDPDAAQADGAQNDASKSAAEPEPPSWGRLFTSIAGNRNGVITKTIPDMTTFWYTGHNWFTLLFGFLGGHFARFVYRRRIDEPPIQSKAQP